MVNDLPPLSKYLRYLYKEKVSQLIGQPTLEAVPLAHLQREFFSPTLETNQNTPELLIKLGEVSASSILKELRDISKDAARRLSSIDGEFSWENISESTHSKGLNKMAVNNYSEISFGGTTRQIQNFGRIFLTNAG